MLRCVISSLSKLFDTFNDDLFNDVGWYSLKRDCFEMFLKSTNEFIDGFFNGFYLVIDLFLPSSSTIFTPAAIPLSFSIKSIIDCAFSLNIGASLTYFYIFRYFVSFFLCVSINVGYIFEIDASFNFFKALNLFYGTKSLFCCVMPLPWPNILPS